MDNTLRKLSDAALAAELKRLDATLARKRHGPAQITTRRADVVAEIERRAEDGSPDVNDNVTVERF